MSSNFTSTEENYIKAIYHLQEQEGSVSTNQLSASLHTKPATVTDMLKKLKAKSLLEYEPYKNFQLTSGGKKEALIIIRRHRLWEYFLVEKLAFRWNEVHEVAEELEHVGSKKLIDKLDEFLDFPRFDPHGDPIPDANGKMSVMPQVCLTELPLNKAAQVVSVGSQANDLLELLSHKNIGLGTRLEIKKKFAFDGSIEVKIKSLAPVNISEQLAKALFVRVM